MTRLALALLALGTSVAAHAAPIQWATGAGGNGHWYELVASPNQLSWGTAEANANASSHQGAAGYLASITSTAENDWVFANIVKGTSAWFGGTQTIPGNQSSWKWSNGESWGFTAWDSGQPDNYAGGTQHTFYYDNATVGKLWHDAPDHWGGIPKAYVVEYAAPVPEPETYAMMLVGLGLLGVVARRRKQKAIA